LLDCDVFLRILNLTRYIVNEVLQVMRARRAEKTSPIAVGIDVRNGVLLELVAMGFDPLGRA
jgi:RNase adaptor protein for sRNA GlmZ degradation